MQANRKTATQAERRQKMTQSLLRLMEKLPVISQVSGSGLQVEKKHILVVSEQLTHCK